MKLSLQPFENSAWVTVPLTPLGYVLAVGKRQDQVPFWVPDKTFPVTVYVELPEIDPEEGLALIRQNASAIRRLAAQWLIAPANLN